MRQLNLRRLYYTDFPSFYHAAIKGEEVDEGKLLSLAMLFVNLSEDNINKLGYRLFLLYSIRTGDYKPLYLISLAKGLIPVSQFIYDKMNYREKHGNIFTEITDIQSQELKIGDTYRTTEQLYMRDFVVDGMEESQILIAPTSYGKTEFIIEIVRHFHDKKVCIVTPTKALLAQTKKRIIEGLGDRKIITQPEMYSDDTFMIAVLTQERLIRFLQLQPNIKVDVLIIDESHNLLEEYKTNSQRSILLTSAIAICKKRNPGLVCKYLTPFLRSSKSFAIRNARIDSENYTVNETIKTEQFIFHDIGKDASYIFDQFSTSGNRFTPIESGAVFNNDAELIVSKLDRKNIVYLNKPRDVESMALQIAELLPEIDSDVLRKASNDIRSYIHKDYKLAKLLTKGVIYHHGCVPESIRYYIEELYIKCDEIKIVVTNSTLLEGVNIPATTMFISDPKKGSGYLSPSAFRNLIGRVCRFNDIFGENGDLSYLMPNIHIIKGKYAPVNMSMLKFANHIKLDIQREDAIVDEVRNPLLVQSRPSGEDLERALEMLENVSDDEIDEDYNGYRPETEVGKLCYRNNIVFPDIKTCEHTMQNTIRKLEEVGTVEDLFPCLDTLFFKNFNNSTDNKIDRLRKPEAQFYYELLLRWRIDNESFGSMVSHTVGHWKRKADRPIYVGRWGEIPGFNGRGKLYVEVRGKSSSQLSNLAIVRLKEEYDFIDNHLIKYIEVIRGLNLLTESLYNKIKYGTDSGDEILLINCGISPYLANILKQKYSQYFEVDINTKTIGFNDALISAMEEAGENGVLIAEVKMNTKERQS